MLLIAAAALVAQPSAPPPATLRSELAPFAFFVGHCWRMTDPRRGETDTHCFTPMYGGQHVRDVHIVRGLKIDYRGETIFSSDKAARVVRFRYVNSVGELFDGTMRPRGADLAFAIGQAPPSIVWQLRDDGYEMRTGGRVLRFRRVS